jgi:hypothetical protein
MQQIRHRRGGNCKSVVEVVFLQKLVGKVMESVIPSTNLHLFSLPNSGGEDR